MTSGVDGGSMTGVCSCETPQRDDAGGEEEDEEEEEEKEEEEGV